MLFFLRGNLGGLRANLLGAFVDGGLKRLRLGFESFGLAAGLLALIHADASASRQRPGAGTEDHREHRPAWFGTTAAGW